MFRNVNSGVQEVRSSGVQEARSSGGQEFRRPGVQEAKNQPGGVQVMPRSQLGVQEARGWPGVNQESRRINSDKVVILINYFRGCPGKLVRCRPGGHQV